MDTVKLLSVDINSISKEAAKSIENIKNIEFEARRSLLAIKDSSHLLVNDMLEQQQRRTKSYIVELKTVSEQLRELSYNIRFSGVSSRMVLSINDSIRKVDEFKSFISQSISLLVSQIQNEYFSSDKNFYQTWILYFNDLTNLRIHLSGYDPYTVLVDWETLVESGSRFINKINGYLMYEPFEKNNKKILVAN